MMEEVRKKIEAVKELCKEKLKSCSEQEPINCFKQKIQNYFFKKKVKSDDFDDMLFLIRYSLKYKSVCMWPSYNDLHILNVNLNDNFQNLKKNNDAFFESFKKKLTEGEETNKIEEGFDKKEKKLSSEEGDIANDIIMPLKKKQKDDMLNKKEARCLLANTHFNEDITFFKRVKIQCFMYIILNNYRVKTLLDSLSALRRPISIIYINCPNNKHPKRTLSEKIANLFTKQQKINEIAISKGAAGKLNESETYETINQSKREMKNETTSEMDNEIKNAVKNEINNDAKNEIKSELDNEMTKGWTKRMISNTINKRKGNTGMDCVSCSQEEQLCLEYSTSIVQEEKENYLAGYNPINNTIWICANNVNNVYKLKYIILHHLMHAFDFARANIDAYNCHHIACTEIRAYNMSNQCGYFNSKHFKGNRNVFENLKNDQIQKTEKNKCIYNNTYSSLYHLKPCKNNPEKYINDVFQKCVIDYWPFMCAPERDSKYKPSKIMHKDY